MLSVTALWLAILRVSLSDFLLGFVSIGMRGLMGEWTEYFVGLLGVILRSTARLGCLILDGERSC